MNAKHLLISVCVFFIGVTILFAMYPSPLVDDLVHYADVLDLHRGIQSNYEIIEWYFNDKTRITRPISPILLGSMIVVSQVIPPMFFAWGILYVPIIFLLYKILNKYFDNPWFSLLVCTMVLLFPLSSTSIFSPVMQSISYVIYAFLFSVLLSDKKSLFSYAGIGFFTLTTMLFYEITAFMYPLLALLIWIQNKEKRFVKLFLAFVLPIFLALIYKRFVAKYLFADVFIDYSVEKFVLDFDRIKKVPFAIFRTFFLDWYGIVNKSFKMITYYSAWDFILVILGGGISTLMAIHINTKQRISNIHIGIFLALFISTIFVYFISIYSLSSFSYDNRILFWTRFVSMILLGMLINNLLYSTKNSKLLNRVLRVGLGVFLFTFFITIISQKNSWIAAAKYDKEIIENLDRYLPVQQEKINILYIADKKNKENFITGETSLRLDDSFDRVNAIQRIYGKHKFKVKRIDFYTPEEYSLYSILGKEFHKQIPPNLEVQDDGILIWKEKFPYPFFIFDERNNSVIEVNNRQDFKIK